MTTNKEVQERMDNINTFRQEYLDDEEPSFAELSRIDAKQIQILTINTDNDN